MRINKFIAQATGMSRRAADKAIETGSVTINSQPVQPGEDVSPSDTVTLDGRIITPRVNTMTIMLNKPPGYVCSRDGQGNKTIYELLPPELHHLKPVGRLDKNSSGLLLLTDDGDLANRLTHPRYQKEKVYEVKLDKPLTPDDSAKIEQGIMLEDGLSSLRLTADSKQRISTVGRKLYTVNYVVRMAEGRNRQIRRTFEALGYKVSHLHRTHLGKYALGSLESGSYHRL